MIILSRASLDVSSDVLSLDEITERIGVDPDVDSPQPEDGRSASWTLTTPFSVITGSQHEDEPLRWLLGQVEARRVAALGPDCDVLLSWYGTTRDAPNVWLPADLVQDVAALGCAVLLSFSLEDPADPVGPAA